MERDIQDKQNEILSSLPKLKYPSILFNFNERIKSHKFNSGFVLGITIDEEDPSQARVFFDGGRRRITESGDQGIVLECYETSVYQLKKKNIRPGDLIHTNYLLFIINKVASPEDLLEMGIQSPQTRFDWEKVIGFV